MAEQGVQRQKDVNGQELLRATKNRKAIIAYTIKDHDIYVCMYNKEKTKISSMRFVL